MGLSIHYSGSISNPEFLQELIKEVQDISGIYGWPCEIYENEFNAGLFGRKVHNQLIYGVSFTPPECETVYISFLSNGKMSSPVQLKLYGDTEIETEKKYLHIISVKTQFAGAEVHMMLIQLFRYLSQKYFARFNMSDEGTYWETSDEQLLRENFKKYSELFSSFCSSMKVHPFKTNETIENYFQRLLKLIEEKKRNNKQGEL